MSRQCTICAHPHCVAIEEALRSEQSLRTTGRRWSVSKTAILRYQDTHLLPVPAMPLSPQESQAAEAVHQESLTPLAPEIQEALAEYQKVTAILNTLLTLTETDWQRWARWQVRKSQVMLPLWSWKVGLESQLRGWGVNLK